MTGSDRGFVCTIMVRTTPLTLMCSITSVLLSVLQTNYYLYKVVGMELSLAYMWLNREAFVSLNLELMRCVRRLHLPARSNVVVSWVPAEKL